MQFFTFKNTKLDYKLGLHSVQAYYKRYKTNSSHEFVSNTFRKIIIIIIKGKHFKKCKLIYT